MTILIGGDLVPTSSNSELFINAETESLLGGKLHKIWNNGAFRIFNLETPLDDHTNPIKKCGINFHASKKTINGIRELKPSLVTLSNNHILDQGYGGLKSTIDLLSKNHIPYIGVGNNKNDAGKPFISNIGDRKVGFYACAEHEFSIATNNSPGANPFDPFDSLEHIEDLKKQCDYVIILYHGGKEYYRYPSPYLQKVCRKMIDKGADLVVCQHSHCIGCYEEYSGASIIYGQGNFIFDDTESDFLKTSLILEINLLNNYSINYIPVIKNGNKIRLAEEDERSKILSEFQLRSEQILKQGFIEENYKLFAEKYLNNYLRSLSGLNKYVCLFDKYIFKGKLTNTLYKSKKLLAIQNYIECEAHRELLLEGVKNKINQD
ncbi:MAG: CapA family protein [Paludibacter sp.]|nr:CapA family protein [Paludibacter sp.]